MRLPVLAAATTAPGQLNDFICETHRLDTHDHEAFIVLALVVMDTLTGEAAFLAAGAEPTLILRANGTAEPVEITGLPLGIEPGAQYMAVTALLASGETVLMATDGITEARRGAARHSWAWKGWRHWRRRPGRPLRCWT